MRNPESYGVVSVSDKNGVPEFMGGLVGAGWRLFATEGSAEAFHETSEERVGSLDDLVELYTNKKVEERESTALAVAGLLTRRCVQLVCVNLRPPKLVTDEDENYTYVNLDVGGTAMITAAVSSGILTVTHQEDYGPLQKQLTRQKEGVSPSFRDYLHEKALLHNTDHNLRALKMLPV